MIPILIVAIIYAFVAIIAIRNHNKDCKTTAELLRKTLSRMGYAQWTCSSCGTRLSERDLFWYNDKPMCRPCQYEELNKPQPSTRMTELVEEMKQAATTRSVSAVYEVIKNNAVEIEELTAHNPADDTLWKISLSLATKNLFMKGDTNNDHSNHKKLDDVNTAFGQTQR